MSSDEKRELPLGSSTYYSGTDRFRLCCCHVRIWALVIAVLEIVSLFINVLSLIGSFVNGAVSFGGLMGGIVGFILGLIVAAILIEGVKQEKHLYLLPHMAFQVMSILGCVIGAIVVFVAGEHTEDIQKYRIYVGAGVTMLLVAGLQIFFFFAVLRCYCYLKEKSKMN